MAAEWIIEGWDLYPATDITALVGNPWSAGAATVDIDAVLQRNGRACCACDSGLTDPGATRPLLSAIGAMRIIMGFAIRKSADGSSGSNVGIRVDGGNYGVRVNGSNQIGINMGAGATFSTELLASNTYRYIVIDWDITNQLADMYIDRRLIISGVATAVGPLVSCFAHLRSFNGQQCAFDDCFWVVDPTAGERASILAALDFVVQYPMPVADQVTQNWNGSGAAPNYQYIDNQPYNGAEYIEATTPGDISDFDNDTFLAGTFQIIGMQHYYYAYKTDAAVGDVQASINGSAGANNAMATGKQYFIDDYITNPSTGVAWVPADTVATSFERTA